MTTEGEHPQPGPSSEEQTGRGSRVPQAPRDANRSDLVPRPSRSVNPAMPSSSSALQPQRSREGTLTHIIETLLDKGLVINADITVSLAGVELLGIRVRAALASFDTAARYGLDFPSGTDRNTVAWNESSERKDTCPQCGKMAPVDQLLYEFCPWCGWRSALAIAQGDGQRSAARGDESGDDRGDDSEETAP